jgi:hypothetical protein
MQIAKVILHNDLGLLIDIMKRGVRFMERTLKKLVLTAFSVFIILFVMVLFSSPSYASVKKVDKTYGSAALQTSSSTWQDAYKTFLKHPKRNIGKLIDDSYYKMYFGKNYKLNRYMLYDTNKDGVPELFLYIYTSDIHPEKKYGTLGFVLTYLNGKVQFVEFTNAIGVKNGYILEKGHWHGAGDPQPEWSGLRIHPTSKYLLNLFHVARHPYKTHSFYMYKWYVKYNGYEKTTYHNRFSKKHYKKVYRKYVKGYKPLYKYFKNGSSVKDTGLIDRYN